MSDPRGHHLVAQLYQRGFARRRKSQWYVEIRDRATGLGGIRNVRDTFKRRDWNTIVDADGNRDYDVERQLADRVDTPAAPALDLLRNGSLPTRSTDIRALAVWMTAQLNRGRFIRENLSEFLVETHRMILKVAAANYTDTHWLRALGRVPSQDEIERIAHNEDHIGLEPTNALLLDTLLAPVNEIAPMLVRRTWTLVEFDEPYLFTGEHPVVHITGGNEDMGYGVATAEQLYLPVSTTHGLLLSHPWSSWPEAHVRGPRKLAERLNWAVLIHPSNQELLFHPDIEAHPLPDPSTLDAQGWWPWGEDPSAAPPPSLRLLNDAQQRGALAHA